MHRDRLHDACRQTENRTRLLHKRLQSDSAEPSRKLTVKALLKARIEWSPATAAVEIDFFVNFFFSFHSDDLEPKQCLFWSDNTLFTNRERCGQKVNLNFKGQLTGPTNPKKKRLKKRLDK